jgi:hypothetical protein
MKTNLMKYLSSVYFLNKNLHVSGISVAHHQEVYIRTTIGTCCAFSWLTVGLPAKRQSTEKHNMYHLLYTYSTPPDDGPQISPEHVEFDWGNKLRINSAPAGPSGRAVSGVGLRPLACWDCGFESHRGHGCYVVSVMCCQVEVCAKDWSLVQRSPTDCGASFFVIEKPRKRGSLSPLPGCENTTTMGCNARKTNNKQIVHQVGFPYTDVSRCTVKKT